MARARLARRRRRDCCRLCPMTGTSKARTAGREHRVSRHIDGSRARTLLGPALATLVLLLVAVSLSGCTLMVDPDGVTGHPCDGEEERCLPGYSCGEGICHEDPSTGVLICRDGCRGDEKCDWRFGECRDPCDASICPTGWACLPGGECAPVEEGIGASCETDADCAGAIEGCSVDPENPGRVQCACLKAASGAGGLCVGIPSMADDCEACGEAQCMDVDFSYSGTTLLCVAGGFRPCAEGQAHCEDPDVEAWCAPFAWPGDPGAYLPGEPRPPLMPLGYLAACASRPEDASLAPGESCDPQVPGQCTTGLCLSAGEGHVCTHPCKTDTRCRGVAAGRCVSAPLDLFFGPRRMFEVAEVCGAAPTLGRLCGGSGDDPACGTDAPFCTIGPENRGVCTRACRGDEDCSPEQGFVCHGGRAQCL